jgi:GDP-L-fucose synthase
MEYVMQTTDKILLIGAGGLLGNAVALRLKQQGFSNVHEPTSKELDCLDAQSTTRFFDDTKPTIVFHLAAVVFGLKGNLNNQFFSLTRNTLMNHNVLTACASTGVKKIFFAGTVASYAFPYLNLPLDEADLMAGPPHAGEFGYASAKRHALAYLQVMKADFGIDFVYGVLTNMYGPHDRFDVENGHVIPSLIRKAALATESGNSFEVWGNPATTRDYMYSHDAASAIIHLMHKSSGAINIASGETSHLGAVVDAIRSNFPGLPPTVWRSDMPVGIPARSVSAARLREIGSTPHSDLAAGIRATCDWYKQNKDTVRL